MHCVVKSSVARRLAWFLSLALVAPYVGLTPSVAGAQERTRELATVAVLGFQDQTAAGPTWLGRNATDAVAMALEDSGEFLVTPQFDVARERRALSLEEPLSPAEQVRLGRRLEVGYIGTGEVISLGVNPSDGSVSIKMQLRLLNVEVAEYLDGAVQEVRTKGLPGYEGDPADAINEALRDCAEAVVSSMLATRVATATIESISLQGQIRLNVGHQEGMRPGMNLVVIRQVYLPQQEMSVQRKIGKIHITETHPTMSIAQAVGDVTPRTGDKAFRIYEPYIERERAVRKRQARRMGSIIVAAGLLLGLVAVGTGTSFQTPPKHCITYCQQAAMGEQPVIRFQFAAPDKAHGHLLFRGFNAGFPATAPWLVQASGNPNGIEILEFIDDMPDMVDEQTLDLTVNFRDEEGEYTTEDVSLTWTHPALDPGVTYWHKVARVTEPNLPPGANPPLAGTTSVSTAQAAAPPPFPNPDNEIDADYDWPMISQPSAPAGPVTYILPPAQQGPRDGSSSQSTSRITFEWRQTQGADEYVVQVYPANDALGLRSPIYQSPSQLPTGAGSMSLIWDVPAGDLQAGQRYFWRIGARRSSELDWDTGQGVPVVGMGSRAVRGWVLSTMWSFETAGEPPQPPLGSSGSGTDGGPPAVPSTASADRGSPGPRGPADRGIPSGMQAPPAGAPSDRSAPRPAPQGADRPIPRPMPR